MTSNMGGRGSYCDSVERALDLEKEDPGFPRGLTRPGSVTLGKSLDSSCPALFCSKAEEFKECFSLYDKGQRGRIKANDLLVVMRCLGASPTPGEVGRHLLNHKLVDDLLREANIGPNGKVKYNEFIQKITRPAPDY
ncbi:calmodulin-like protein 4 isoform X5 [Monodelphis domestica]|uniref:calmodulin-like protein 4 isoform X5 n=1 Tax=Monodelphis domestica TaxID=13616 RepID=UPI0024E274F6|nr:calmodulin-like protein 4 isoform X5 [Monodelphis domestica]